MTSRNPHSLDYMNVNKKMRTTVNLLVFNMAASDLHTTVALLFYLVELFNILKYVFESFYFVKCVHNSVSCFFFFCSTYRRGKKSFRLIVKLVILKMTMIQGLFKTFIQMSEKIFTLDNLLSIHVCF